ncbi:septum formation initiator family protein [Borrelia turcica IST7]|uniref:Septum formation initiator family protein n=1 Tax=Borrelia turcica IST7 TaxID=1104446 RepID=A0A386PNA7_9SPIR|nr:septum formation initiator family protein [Borrelia turcica]AYE36595.1 septum formation initiator family protein [Borrelia turcica IST7]
MFLIKKIILSIYVGLISYFIITPIFGERGIVNYKELHNNLILMKNHIETLKETQKTLKTRYINLQISKPAILREASKIGYYPKNSIIIKNPDDNENYNQGKILHLQNTSKNNNIDKNFYLISIVISLIFYFVLSYLETLKILNKGR